MERLVAGIGATAIIFDTLSLYALAAVIVAVVICLVWKKPEKPVADLI